MNLADFVNADPSDSQFVEGCEIEARALVETVLGKNVEKVPEPILKRAFLEVGADLFYRRSSRGGLVGFDGDFLGGATPVRIARDPLKACREMLRPWLPLGFA